MCLFLVGYGFEDHTILRSAVDRSIETNSVLEHVLKWVVIRLSVALHVLHQILGFSQPYRKSRCFVTFLDLFMPWNQKSCCLMGTKNKPK